MAVPAPTLESTLARPSDDTEISSVMQHDARLAKVSRASAKPDRFDPVSRNELRNIV